jgi:hypothetical protein
MADRQDRAIQNAAANLKITRTVLEEFFPGASGTFWRNFKFDGYTWEDVRNAFIQARADRQTSPRSGISRGDAWIPRDCDKALELLVLLLHYYIHKGTSH